MAGMPALTATLRAPAVLRRLTLALLAANVGIVVTGGAVRLTGSGLGCPTWPECTPGSYTATRALGIHGAIEYGNRLLSFVLAGLAILVLAGVLARRDRSRTLLTGAVAVLAGIPAQAVLGGITVLTRLNPWVVAGHFLLSVAVIAAAYVTWRAARAPLPAARAAGTPVPAPLRLLAWLVVAASAATVVAGAVVTASGPHAGDADARRTGLDPAMVSQLHADVVFFLLGLSVALWFALRGVAASGGAVRAAGVLVGIELAQGAVGMVQYFTHLPTLLVGLHMLGACLVWIAALAVLAEIVRPPAGPRAGTPGTVTPGTGTVTPGTMTGRTVAVNRGR